MRKVFLRIFALAIVVAMGLLAIAHAQRATPDPFAGQPAGGDAPPNPLRATTPADSAPNPPSGDFGPPSDNPLRVQQNSPLLTQQNSTVQQAPAPFRSSDNNPLRAARDNSLNTAQDNPLRAPPADPFRPRNVTNDRAVRTVAADEPATGPALMGPTQLPPGAEKAPGLQQTKGEPELLPTNGTPDLPATPPFADDRPPSTNTLRAGAMPTATIPPTAPPAYRSDPPIRNEMTANSRPASDPYSAAPAPAGNSATESIVSASGAEGAGQPGQPSLEGPQSPQLMVQKFAPPEVQVDRPAVLRTVVRNTGAAPASDVEIHDMIPKGTRLLGTAPHAQQGPRGELIWSIGSIKPGEETTVEMQVVPVDEGDIGSVATVQFHAAATSRSRCTRPRLVVNTVGTPQVLMGDEAALTFMVSNPGTGIATGVVLQERIPAGAQHPAGKELEYTVGDLRPGESRKLELRLKATQAGTINNVILARADAGLKAEHRFAVQVLSPQLNVVMSGPKHRYLEREATYQVSVTNPGTAPAQQVQLVAYLPPGLKFVNANNAGHYDEASRAVSWRLDELPVNAQGSVELVTLPVESGQQSIKLRGTAQRGLAVEKEHPVIVEGLASVSFQMAHTRDPIEIGGETSYEVNVVNQGSKASTNVRLTLNMPPQLKPLAAEGPSRYTVSDNQVVFESLPQLPPKSVVTYRVKAKGIQAGDLRIRCQLMTDEMQAPVSKEDSTRVYGDE